MSRRAGSTSTRVLLIAAVCAAAALLSPRACAALASTPPFPPSAARAMELPPSPARLADLIEGAAVYDGKQVAIEGEVVGDVMNRESHLWINVSDGSATIGVWGPPELMRQVRLAGSYKQRGDRVLVTGVFRRADPVQGGELDVEAVSLRVTSPGERTARPVTAAQVLRAALSLVVALAFGAAWARAARRRPAATKP